jgi:hypothetical protein
MKWTGLENCRGVERRGLGKKFVKKISVKQPSLETGRLTD